MCEVVAIGAGAALVAALPQDPDAAGIERFAAQWPVAGRVTAALGLHSIVRSGWFLALVASSTASLVLVQRDQWGRLRRLWSAGVRREAFADAPFRRERPLAPGEEPPESFVRSGRLGLLGSPVFHLGLLAVVVAGLVRLLFFSDAVARLAEGGMLGTVPEDFEAQRGGLLARPFAMPVPLRLDSLLVTRYASGALEQIEARVSLLGAGGVQARTLAINAPLDFPGNRRIYLFPEHGVAALCRRSGPAGDRDEVVPLEPDGESLRGRLWTDGGEVRLRTRAGDDLPGSVEVRVLRGGTLLGAGEASAGDGVAIEGSEIVRIVRFTRWGKLRATQDPSRPLFFTGVALALAGVTMMFGFVTVDAGVFVAEGRVIVALRPHRFPPLFADRFERLCKEWKA